MSRRESYHLTEPHPSVPTSHYIYSGRGGAGNISRVNPSKITDPRTASGPASLVKLPPPPSNALFTSGRGGAGNVHREKERAIFSFDEELERQRRVQEHQAPVYHVGRGGAGNLVDEMKPRGERVGSASSSASSGSSEGGGKKRGSIDAAWHRVSRTWSRQ